MWETLFKLLSWLASLAVHYSTNKDVSSRLTEQTRKLQEKKRKEWAWSLRARCIKLSSWAYNCTFEYAYTAPSDQGSCSVRTRVGFFCEPFVSPRKVDALFWASARRVQWIIHDLNAWSKSLIGLLMFPGTQRTRFKPLNLHRDRTCSVI